MAFIIDVSVTKLQITLCLFNYHTKVALIKSVLLILQQLSQNRKNQNYYSIKLKANDDAAVYLLCNKY